MRRFCLALFILISLFCFAPSFSQAPEKAGEEVLSLKQIDSLIDSEKYNEALREVSRYMVAYPKDFDRAQKRIDRIMKIREQYNDGAASLVEVIKSGEENRAEKLTKIRELEISEKEPTAYVSDFLDLARRTVTLGEVLVLYNRIMSDGTALVQKEKYLDAAMKFQEGFAIKNEKSDVIFDSEEAEAAGEGRVVVYENDITLPVSRSVANVKNYIAGSRSLAGMAARLSECEKAYEDYIKVLSAGNFIALDSALKKVTSAFEKYADLRKLVMAEASVLERANRLAVERNPRLENSSYIYFQERFIVGDESNPDTGIVGAMDAYFNNRIESMKKKTCELVLSTLESVKTNLSEKAIFDESDKIDVEKSRIKNLADCLRSARSLHSLYALEKNADGKSLSDYHKNFNQSMDFALEFITAMTLSLENSKSLAGEAFSYQNPVESDSLDDTEDLLGRIMRYGKILSDINAYVAMANEEYQKEDSYFSEKKGMGSQTTLLLESGEEKIVSPLPAKRRTAGLEVSDDMLDFRSSISFFLSLTSLNVTEAKNRSQRLWVSLARSYSSLARESYSYYDKICSDCEKLLEGEETAAEMADENEDSAIHFVKKYPKEAREKALSLRDELNKKKNDFSAQKKTLSASEEYRMTDIELNTQLLNFDLTVSDFDKLSSRCSAVIADSEKQVRSYELLLRQAYEQYELAQSSFKKENFDAANAAVESASEKFAAALDLEYSDSVREMREGTLNGLALKIQQAEYAKVLREVYSLKDKAATAYYSSNFDGAESLLVSAQAKWAKVSTEADPEIEELLSIVTTVKGVAYGRVLELSDPHYPELSYSLDMARQNFERGVELKKQKKEDEAKESFGNALSYVRNVQNVYPLNKSAQLINLGIQRELDPEGFPRLFEQQYNAAKSKSDRRERLAELEDLYEVNPNYPGLAQEIYNIKDSLGMFPKKEVKKEVKKSADTKIAEARRAFKNAGDDEDKLNAALRLANEAIAIDSSSKAAKELKLDIQLKIGSTATAILSQNDEKMYAEAARLFNQRRFADAKSLMDRLLTGRAAKKSRKVIDLYNRILKRV